MWSQEDLIKYSACFHTFLEIKLILNNSMYWALNSRSQISLLPLLTLADLSDQLYYLHQIQFQLVSLGLGRIAQRSRKNLNILYMISLQSFLDEQDFSNVCHCAILFFKSCLHFENFLSLFIRKADSGLMEINVSKFSSWRSIWRLSSVFC